MVLGEKHGTNYLPYTIIVFADSLLALPDDFQSVFCKDSI